MGTQHACVDASGLERISTSEMERYGWEVEFAFFALVAVRGLSYPCCVRRFRYYCYDTPLSVAGTPLRPPRAPNAPESVLLKWTCDVMSLVGSGDRMDFKQGRCSWNPAEVLTVV